MSKQYHHTHSHTGLKIFCVIMTLIVLAGCALGGLQLWAPEGKNLKPSEWFHKGETAEISLRTSFAEEGFAVPCSASDTRVVKGIGTKSVTATCKLSDGGSPDRYQWTVLLDGQPDDGEYFTVAPQNERAETIQITALKYFPGIAELTVEGYRGYSLCARGKADLLFDKSVCPLLQVVYLTDGSELYQQHIQVLRDYDEASENCRICYTPFTTIDEYFNTFYETAGEFYDQSFFEFVVICDEKFRLFDLFDAHEKTHKIFKEIYGYLIELGECSDENHRDEDAITQQAREISSYASFSPVEDFSYVVEDYIDSLHDRLGDDGKVVWAHDIDPEEYDYDCGFFDYIFSCYPDSRQNPESYLYVDEFSGKDLPTYLDEVQLFYLRDEYDITRCYKETRRHGLLADYLWFLPDVHEENEYEVKDLIENGATVLAFRKAMDVNAIYEWIDYASSTGDYSCMGINLYNSVERII